MKSIPSPSAKRLAVLSQLLLQQPPEKQRITSSELSAITTWTESTIRKDISFLELYKGKSNGYEVSSLYEAICASLSLKKSSGIHKCCVVGLGKLGEALLSSSFENSNFKIVAGFDSNANRIELLQSTIPLYSTADFERVMKMEKMEYALLAVGDDKAQKYAEKIARAGIKGIVNYTGAVLVLPSDVAVHNAGPASALTLLLTK